MRKKPENKNDFDAAFVDIEELGVFFSYLWTRSGELRIDDVELILIVAEAEGGSSGTSLVAAIGGAVVVSS